MTIPFDCGSLDPESMKYIRFSRGLRAPYVDWADACEVAAFVRFLGMRDAVMLMGWDAFTVKYVKKLIAHVGEHADPYVNANLEAAQVEDAYKFLKIAQARGSTMFHTNPLVRRAIQQEWHDTGITRKEQAKKLGITVGEVQWQRLWEHRRRARAVSRGPLVAFG